MTNGPVEREQLRKSLSAFALFTLAFGTIIGVGWVTVLGAWLSGAGSLGAMIAFFVGGLVMLPVALCYAEAAGMYPVSGGEVAYIYEMYGERLSFVSGWLLAYLYIATTSFEAISVGWVISAMFPGIEGPTIYSFLGADVKLWSLLIGIAITGLLTLVNYRGANATASFQNLFVAILIIASLVFVVAGLTNSDFSNFEPAFADVKFDGAMVGILTVLASTPFWFAGFDTIPQAMGELSEDVSLKKLPRIMVMAVGGAIIFYILIILTASVVVERDVLLSFDLPLAGALQAAFGNQLVKQMVLFAGLCGLITTWNAMLYGGTRVIFALGRAHMIPHRFAHVHAKYGSPSTAVLFTGLVCALGSLMGREAIQIIVGASSLVFSILFVLIIWGLIRLRKRLPDHPRPYKFPGGRVGLGLALVVASGIMILAAVEPLFSNDGGIPPELMMVGAWLLLGLIFYVLAAPMRGQISAERRRWLTLNED